MNKILKSTALLALLGFPLAVIGFRLGLFEFSVSALMIMATVVLAVAVFFVGMTITFVKRRSNPTLSKAARTASYLVLIPIIAIGSQFFKGSSVPRIHNISTDVVNPPEFGTFANARAATDNPLMYDPEKLAQVQQAAYPMVKTLITDLPALEAHAKALEVANSLGWEVVESDPSSGFIGATETSTLWGFKDDVVVRISEQDGQRAVDLRSVSRIGQSDLGANAKRIERFLSAFSE